MPSSIEQHKRLVSPPPENEDASPPKRKSFLRREYNRYYRQDQVRAYKERLLKEGRAWRRRARDERLGIDNVDNSKTLDQTAKHVRFEPEPG
jgi:hypothetical protein